MNKAITKERYFKKAHNWDEEILAGTLQSKNRAWLLTFSSMGLLGLSLSAHLFILPLKSYEPYVITVERQSGYAELSRKLERGPLSQERAITESNLVRYVVAREQYNPALLRENYTYVSAMSTNNALGEFKKLWSASYEQNPSKLYGNNASVDIRIKSVSLISENLASVRFIKTKTALDQETASHWNAIIEFGYSEKPLKMLERFQNPLGFEVISYRTNPETREISQ
jgi:type IV secretion system protein VirB8